MKIDSTYKLVFAIIGLYIGFKLPDIWAFIQSLFG